MVIHHSPEYVKSNRAAMGSPWPCLTRTGTTFRCVLWSTSNVPISTVPAVLHRVPTIQAYLLQADRDMYNGSFVGVSLKIIKSPNSIYVWAILSTVK